MRARTKKDDRIAKKKYFEVGDIVKLHIYKHINHVTLEEEEKDIHYVIVERVHQFEGAHGTYYKCLNMENGNTLPQCYLHDIPEDQVTIEVIGKK